MSDQQVKNRLLMVFYKLDMIILAWMWSSVVKETDDILDAVPTILIPKLRDDE